MSGTRRWSRCRFEVGARDRLRLRGHLLGQGARLRARRPAARAAAAAARPRRASTTTATSSSSPTRAERHDAGAPLARPARSTARASSVHGRARAARALGACGSTSSSRRSGDESAAHRRAAFGEERATSATRSPPGSCACRSCARAGTTLEPLVPAVGHRPRLAAHARRRRRDRQAARRRHAVVHDRVRPRHAHHVPADAPLRPRARARRARRARRRCRRGGRPARSTPSRARSSTRCGAARRRSTGSPRYYGTVDATPLYLVLLSEVWRWTDDTAARARAEGAGAARARVDRRATATATATASSSTSGAPTRAREPVVEGLLRLAALPDGRSRDDADRAVRGAGLRLRREASASAELAREVWRDRAARRAARARGGRAAGSASTRRSGSRSAAATTRSRSTATSGRSTRSCSNIGHLLWSRDRPAGARRRGRRPADGRRPLVGLGRPHDVGRRRRLQPAQLPQRHRLAPRQLPDRVGPRALRPLAGGAPDRARAMLDAADHFDYQLPEVFAGLHRAETPFPIAYPTAARPQAWAAGDAGAAAPAAARPRRRTATATALDSVAPAELPSWAGAIRALRRARLRPPLGRRSSRTGASGWRPSR